tara:strand:- start:624 stop:851 length:228 start_codon:yes stop_codon:yes gene_type:complete
MKTIFNRIVRKSGTSKTGEASYQIDKQADLIITYQRPSKKWFVQIWGERDGEYINIEIPQRQARSILSNLDGIPD